MKTCNRIVLIVLFAAILGGFAWDVLRQREPVYQGKPLSVWLEGYERGGWARQNADEAVRQAGTNAIPTLLRMLQEKDSPMMLKLVALARRQHFIKIKYIGGGD